MRAHRTKYIFADTVRITRCVDIRLDVVSEWLWRVIRIIRCLLEHNKYHLGSPAHVRIMPTSSDIWLRMYLSVLFLGKLQYLFDA